MPEAERRAARLRSQMKATKAGAAIAALRLRAMSAVRAAGLKAFLAAERGRSRHERGLRARSAGLRTAMTAHVYYPDLLDEILACHAVLPEGTPCHITTPPEVASRLSQAALERPGVTLHVMENRGRDIAPFLALLQSGAFDGYDAVLKIHAKRSPHLYHGELIRKALFAVLAGRASVVERILDIMSDPGVGLVGWRRVFMTRRRHWHTNRPRVEALAARLDPPARPELAFFGGSMFWFRPAALTSVAALGLSSADFEPEAGQLDGTLHHALERCFSIAAAAAGYATRDTEGKVLLAASPSPAAAPAPADGNSEGGHGSAAEPGL